MKFSWHNDAEAEQRPNRARVMAGTRNERPEGDGGVAPDVA
jgi:hypothetical protein